jgi:hypothetical protein
MANEFLVDEYTSELNELIREVVNDPSTYLGSKWLPSRTVAVNRIRNEVVEATGGLTQEHVPGTAPKAVQRGGQRVQEFQPGFYKEYVLYDESDILYLREMGQNDPSKRGIRQKIDLDIDMLNRRMEARIELLRWQAIFDGSFTWLGKTVSFSVPAANRVTPLGGDWSTDGINANNGSNPVLDLRYWLTGGYAPYRKYNVEEIVMNANTARWVMDNTNTRSWLESIGANPNIGKWDINTVLQLLIPGCPPVTVYKGWYQEQTLVGQKLEVGNAIYFVPDGLIYFANTPMGDKIGSFDQTLQLASGSIESPGVGKFLVVEENIAPGTKGGPANPFIQIIGGVYGGPNLKRGFDLLTGQVSGN